MTKEVGKKIAILALIAFLVLLFVTLSLVSPVEIVEKIGLHNAYLITFVVSLFGGFSAGGSVSFISLLITLVLGGVDPIVLGLISGISLALGDMVMFYAGSKGRKIITGKWDKKIKRLAEVFEKRAWLKKLAPFLAYVYVGFLPLPNDVLILFLAAIEYPPKKMNTILVLGDLTFALSITLLTAGGMMSS